MQTISRYLFLFAYCRIQLVWSQRQNLTCSPTDLRFNSRSCFIRQTNITDINYVDFVDFKPTMTTMAIVSGPISGFPPGFFLKYPQVTTFTIQDATMSNFNGTELTGASNLTLLFMSNTGFSKLQGNSFKKAPNLRNLALYSGILQKIDVSAFSGLKQLTELSITDHIVDDLQVGVFDELIALTYLYISNNRLTTLHSGLFKYISGLSVIEAFENRIKTLPQNLFFNNPKISAANFRDNLLEKVTTLRAQTIDLQNNSLKQVFVTRFTKMASLGLNQITRINCALNLSITTFDPSDNLLPNFRCIRSMTNASIVIASNNNITFIGKPAFQRLTRLSEIRLDGNKLKFLWPRIFAPATGLQSITCDFLSNYHNLTLRYPKLWRIQLNSKTWNCTKFDLATSVLRAQNIFVASNGCSL